jgi:repressor LexA
VHFQKSLSGYTGYSLSPGCLDEGRPSLDRDGVAMTPRRDCSSRARNRVSGVPVAAKAIDQIARRGGGRFGDDTFHADQICITPIGRQAPDLRQANLPIANLGMEFHERLRAARARRFAEAKEAADYLGLSTGTYGHWEAGSRRPKPPMVARLAEVFRVPVGWLQFGEGIPDDVPTRVPLGGHVGAGGRIDTSTEQREPGVEYEIALTTIIPDATVAYQVIGESMLPEFKPNMVIVCRAHTTDPRPHLGKQVVIGTADGARLLKTLVEGTEPERYNLESWNAATMRNVELAWVAHICAYIPADEWQLLEKNGGSAAFKNHAVPPDRKEVGRRYNGKRK